MKSWNEIKADFASLNAGYNKACIRYANAVWTIADCVRIFCEGVQRDVKRFWKYHKLYALESYNDGVETGIRIAEKLREI